MVEIDCCYCKKPITSKNDLVLGTHLANTVTPYHMNCFNDAKIHGDVLSAPVMKIPPKKFKFYLAVNLSSVITGFLILVLTNLALLLELITVNMRYLLILTGYVNSLT